MIKKSFYAFVVLDKNQHPIRGMIDAPNATMARYQLKKMGFSKIKYLHVTLSSYKKIYSLSLKEKHHLFSQLNTLITSGLSLTDCLASLLEENTQFKIKHLIFILLKSLSEGHALSHSFKKIPYAVLSATDNHLIKISEMSGRLDIAFSSIVESTETKLFIKQKIISACIYPCITLFMSSLVIFILFYWVLPQFYVIFSQYHHQLPWLTQVVFSLANHFKSISLSLIIIIVMIIFSYMQLSKQNRLPKQFQEAILKHFPLLGKMCLLKNKIDICFTFYILLHAGIPLHDILHEASQHISLPLTQQKFISMLTELKTGKPLSSLFKASDLFPQSALQILRIAENTGHLDDAFKALYRRFSQELSIFSEHIGRWGEPFIIIILGCIIGFIVIAVYLPIFQLSGLY